MLTQTNQRRCVSPSQSPYFLPPNLPPQAPRAARACHILNTCPNVQSIILAMNPPPSSSGDSNHRSYFKYNFSSLLDSLDDPIMSDDTDRLSYPSRSRRKSPTIEFRQQHGTLDPDIMTHWIRFLGTLVKFAGEISLESLIELLGIEKRGQGTGYRVIDGLHNNSFLSQSQTSPPFSPRTNPAANLSGAQLIGSLSHLFATMESVGILLDPETYGFWRRKSSA